MAKALPPLTSPNRANGSQDQKYNLPPSIVDNDWTRPIHHQLNIKRRTCTTFIPKSSGASDSKTKVNENECGCNRLRREHSWDVLEETNTKWEQQRHTVPAYNNAYGRILQTGAHYIRCDIQTNPKILAQLMYDVWKVPEPQLIMCIIGGAKYFKLNERLEREFIKGIIQASCKADGWIVTSGFKTGVVQLVGEAIHDYKVTHPGSEIIAIGCSKWGGTKNRDALVLNKKKVNLNLDASMNRPKQEKRSQQDLEPNHTHFLLLDDGTYYGYEMGDYRTRFVNEASHYKNKDVPVVTIVVEGGPDTLKTIYKDLRTSIPVVLINGSGRVPNLLANFLIRTEAMINRGGKGDNFDWKKELDINDENNIEQLKTKFRPYVEEIRDGLKNISKGSKTAEKDIDELFKYFIYCLQPAVRSRIQVYSIDGDHDLDDTIFEAIIQAKQETISDSDKEKKNSKEQLLSLALAWDAIEVAKEHIIKDDLSDLNDKSKDKLFMEALRYDRAQFVNTFIKSNFNVAQMFYERKINKAWEIKWPKLSSLYLDDLKKKKKERRFLFHHCYKKTRLEEEDLDQILKKLVGDYMKSIYTPSANGLVGRCLQCCSCPQIARVADSRTNLYREDDDSEVPDPEEAEKDARECIYRDLFFWSILTGRIEMAKVFISHMQTRICPALIASKILKSYQQFAHDNESKEILSTQANQFEDYANESLKCCYNFNEETACEIAIRRIDLFGGVSCLQVAVAADDKSFVGQPCCDQLLNNIWYDKMEPIQLSSTQPIKLVLSVCTLGLLAPVLVTFRDEEVSKEDLDYNQKRKPEMTVNQTLEEENESNRSFLPPIRQRLDKNGIHYSDTSIRPLNFCSKACLLYFYRLKRFHEAPYIKFLYNAASYIFFLLLFSYYLLFDFKIPTENIPSIHWTEILVIIIVSTMLIEDIRKFLCQDNRSMVGKLKSYFIHDIFFTSIRISSYILFYIGLILRFTYASSDEELSVAKIILAYDLEIWFIRSLTFLGVARKMGPKLVMIRKMIIDLAFFVYIIIIAMVAYGVASRAMYQYNTDADTDDLTFDGRSVFRHIVYPVYYLMYGSMDGELQALDRNPDASTAIATQVLLAFHMLFVNILLINLLIAMFSFTFESVQSHTDLVWRYERYSLIREYFDRPALFPPLIIITHFIELIQLIRRHLPTRKRSTMSQKRAKTFKMIATHRQVDKEWSEFESYATNFYARTVVAGQPLSAAVLVPSIAHQEGSQATSDMSLPLSTNFDPKAISDEISAVKRSIAELRTYAETMNTCMEWMMDAMERVKMSRTPKPRLTAAFTTNDVIQANE